MLDDRKFLPNLKHKSSRLSSRDGSFKVLRVEWYEVWLDKSVDVTVPGDLSVVAKEEQKVIKYENL